MPVRRFEAANKDLLRFSKGANDITDAFTGAMLIRPSTIAPTKENAAGLMEGATAANGTGLAGYGFYQSGAKTVFEVDAGGTEKNDENGTAPLLEVGVWYLFVCSRPSGEKQKVTWHHCKFTGGAAGAMSHHESAATQVKASSLGASGVLNLGKASDGEYFFAGDIALAARWNKALTQAQSESLLAGAATWRSLEPRFMVELRQFAVTDEVPDVTGLGGNQVGRSGTSVIAEEPPIPYAPVGARHMALLGVGA